MLLNADELTGISEGRIDTVFRRWRRPTVKPGGTLVTAIGVLAIDAVDVIDDDQLDDAAARRAGHRSAADLLASRAMRRDGRLHRINFHLAGPDPRIVLREQRLLDTSELALVSDRLDRLDRASSHGVWTAETLRLIADNPGVRAADLAATVGRETQPFKTDVRKLKNLGLTESLEVGYRLSPRGDTVLRCLPGTT